MGQLIGFALTGGEVADITQAQDLLRGRDFKEAVADKGVRLGRIGAIHSR